MGKLRKKCWGMVLLWVSLIYATLYNARPLCEFLKKSSPFNTLVNGFLLSFLLLGAVVFVRRIRNRKKSTYILLISLLLTYGFIIWKMRIPEEKIHFLEYGFLAFFIYRALSLDMKSYNSYLLSFLLTALIGWGDEGIQYLLPNRYFEIKDIFLNIAGGLLGLIVIFVIRRGVEERRPR